MLERERHLAERAAQGLPAHLEDPVVAANVVALLLPTPTRKKATASVSTAMDDVRAPGGGVRPGRHELDDRRAVQGVDRRRWALGGRSSTWTIVRHRLDDRPGGPSSTAIEGGRSSTWTIVQVGQLHAAR